MSDLPWLVIGIIHRIIHSVENRHKSLIISLIHINDIDQRNTHPMAIGIQNPLSAGVLFRLFSCQIGFNVIAVHQRGGSIRHMKSGG